MWTCECGEFNNDDAAYCVACKRVRISEKSKQDLGKVVLTTEGAFRKIQDFVLLDIALLCLFAILGFIDIKYGLIEQTNRIVAYFLLLVVVILFQLFLLIGILRMFYTSAINSERNSFFLQKMYETFKEAEKKDNEEGLGPKSPV